MRKMLKVLAGVFLLMSISSCTERLDDHPNDFNEDGTFDHPIDTIVDVENDPKVEYDKNHLLVVFKGRDEISTDEKKKLGILSVVKVPGTRWYSIELDGNHDASSMIKKFRNSNLFELVDYDYIYGKGDEGEGIKDLSVDQRDIFSSIDLSQAYDFMEENGGERGGSKDVIVAVLDTGVDINHLDLRDNIWTNANEIDKNGVDDDSNGYVDDIHGWNFVDNSSNVQDDNGHGTHVAGIIGSEKNNFGTTGIAYNCKIMPVKCGSSSGFFNNSWIASAVSYAASNGADVINMSFGGVGVMSLAVEEALKDAYTTSFLVAAAGNDSAQNENKYGVDVKPNYPACYPYVFGVMSATIYGYESWFTNFDSISNNKIEYNVYAPGENYPSTFPNNKYASLNGTSNSAPVISGIAALIRSLHPEKDIYPTKFLASQIANTSDTPIIPTIVTPRYEPHKYVNAYNALAKASKPNVRLYDYYTFDDKTISEKNNGNGIIDSGETIQIGMELENVGGKSYKTKATINMDRLSEDVKEPYVSINKDCIEFDEIGVYSIRDSGLKYAEDGMTVIGTSNCFEIQIDDKCPDNYMVAINVVIEWEDERGIKYCNKDVIYISVTNRILLKGRIDSDVVLPKNTSYILLSTLTITEKGSLTIEEGVDIQMYNDTSTAYYGEIANSPKIVNNGTLNINGVEGNMVKIHSSELYRYYISYLVLSESKEFHCEYLDSENLILRKQDEDYLVDNNVVKINNSSLLFIGLYCIDDFRKNIATEFIIGDFIFENTTMKFNLNAEVNSFFGIVSLDGNMKAENCQFLFIDCIHNGFSFQNIRTSSYTACSFKSINSKVRFERCLFDNCLFSAYDNGVSDFSFGENGKENHGQIKNYRLLNITEESFFANIHDKNTGDGNGEVEIIQDGTSDASLIPPYVMNLKLINSNGEVTRRINRETFKVQIEFNTDMDTSLDLDVRFGSVEPYAEYKIPGSYIDKRHWEGTYTLNSRIEGGTQRFRITNGRSDKVHNLELMDFGYIYTFLIDTAGSLAMSMQGVDQEDGIHLSWMQDDYETVMGYNVYRRDSKDGQDIKINPTLISKDENSYIDTDVEPGKTYWYSFTYVLSDLTEGKPSNLIQCTARDTIAPVVRHTPVNQGYLGNNLTISCVARDNVSVKEAKLYFRTKGETAYHMTNMIKNNDTYIGSISSSMLSMAGLEYYIEVSDGVNVITKGTASDPYSVIIKDSSVLSHVGDVNGDGIINSKDALMLQQHLAGTIILTDDQFKRGDINGNGKIDAKEIMWILQYINGNITSFDNLK